MSGNGLYIRVCEPSQSHLHSFDGNLTGWLCLIPQFHATDNFSHFPVVRNIFSRFLAAQFLFWFTATRIAKNKLGLGKLECLASDMQWSCVGPNPRTKIRTEWAQKKKCAKGESNPRHSYIFGMAKLYFTTKPLAHVVDKQSQSVLYNPIGPKGTPARRRRLALVGAHLSFILSARQASYGGKEGSRRPHPPL